jgi:hypothetical protein
MMLHACGQLFLLRCVVEFVLKGSTSVLLCDHPLSEDMIPVTTFLGGQEVHEFDHSVLNAPIVGLLEAGSRRNHGGKCSGILRGVAAGSGHQLLAQRLGRFAPPSVVRVRTGPPGPRLSNEALTIGDIAQATTNKTERHS